MEHGPHRHTCCAPGHGPRWVGDPVDVITGHNIFSQREFTVPGAVEFVLRRNYDHTWAEEIRGLGRGFRLGFDQWLTLDVDGMTYIHAEGGEVRFEFLDEDGEEATSCGYRLLRLGEGEYRLTRRGQPDRVFRAGASPRELRLVALERNGAQLRLSYRDERLDTVAIDEHRRLRFRYGEHGQLEQIVLVMDDGRSHALVSYAYDEFLCLVTAEDAYRQQHGYAYDEHHRLVEETDPSGYAFVFEYDRDGRCSASYGQDGLLAVRLEYEPDARQTRVTDANGAQWLYEYGAVEELVSITDPYGGRTSFEYGSGGELRAEIDPAGRRTEYLCDDAGARYARREPDGSIVSLPEPEPRPPSHRVPAMALEWEAGDGRDAVLGLPRGPELPADLPEAILDVITTSAEPGRGRIEAESDELGLLSLQRLEGGRTRRFVYSFRGKLRRYRDFDGGLWKLDMQRWDLPFREEDPNGHVSEFRYTDTAEMAAFIDPEGNAVTYEYDLKDRMTAVLRNGVVVDRYEYDRSDDFVRKRDGSGELLLEREYDARKRLVRRVLASGDVHAFGYDERGNYLAAKSDAGAVTFAVDGGDRRVLDQRDGKGVRRRFSGDGLAQVEVLGFRTRYRRVGSRDWVVVDPTGGEHRIRRHGSGLHTREFANGWRETAQYGPRGWCLLKGAWRADAPERPWLRVYTYSGEGDLVRVVDSARGITTHGYDRAHRLVSTRRPEGGEQRYVYGRSGSLYCNVGLSEVEVGPGNQLRWADGHRFRYDVRQHVCAMLTPDGRSLEYVYDARDQLVAVTYGGQDWWRAAYDALGRRVYKEVGGERTTYYWEGDRLAGEVLPDGRVRVYVYAEAFAMVPMLWVDYGSEDAAPESGQVYVVLADQRGCPERVLDDRGEVVWSARIDPYGWAHVEVGAEFRQVLRFPGHWWDAELRMHYNRFRYYSPWLGRYLQADPLGERGNRNVYAYPANPLRVVDVRGLEDSCVTGNAQKDVGEDRTDDIGKPEAPDAGKTDAHTDATKGGADTDLQALCKRRADELWRVLAEVDPESAKSTTLAVGAVQDQRGQRRIVVTTSADSQELHPKVKSALQPGETFERTPPEIVRGPRYKNPDYDESKPAGRRSNPKTKSDPMIVDPETGNNQIYKKSTGGNPPEGTIHHAEQRMENGARQRGEEVVAQAPSRTCCPGCRHNLGPSRLSKIHPERRGE